MTFFAERCATKSGRSKQTKKIFGHAKRQEGEFFIIGGEEGKEYDTN
tara:strand:- start:92 stop:232 length:141 start_codon:yes stop_codon:yes gene_type:complete